MKKLWNELKFEQLMALLLLTVLTVALFWFGKDKELTYLILGAVIGAFSSNFEKKDGGNNG